jgi:hypothetical protein
MKFVKSFKIFESNNDVDIDVSVVRDILSDISDDDIVTNVSNLTQNSLKSTIKKISILIGEEDEEEHIVKIDVSKYIETLEFVDEYLTGEGYSLEFGHFIYIDTNENESSFYSNDFIEIKEKLHHIDRLKICEIVYKDFELKETIKVPIEIGDTVLGGRFKNKKTVVKKIGKNKKGDITINDKPLLKFRLVKESLKEDVDYYFRHLEDDGFFLECKEDHIRICKPSQLDDRGSYKISSLQIFQWSEIVSEISRYVSEIDYTDKSISYMYVMKLDQKIPPAMSAFSNLLYKRKGLLKEMVLDETFDAGEITSFVIGFK